MPNTRYAQSGDVNIAFQVMGDGPIDIILVPGIVSHVEFLHEFPGYTEFLRRLATFARVVTFDKRGQGLSDGISGAPSLEQRVDDVRAGRRLEVPAADGRDLPVSDQDRSAVDRLALDGHDAPARDRDAWHTSHRAPMTARAFAVCTASFSAARSKAP